MDKITITITLSEGSEFDCISNSDLAVLADWAGKQKFKVTNPDWRRPFALFREGADLLLRRRARATENSESNKEKNNG